MPRGCIILCLQNKTLSCNQAVTLVHHFKFLLQQDRTEKITHSADICCDLYLTWLKQLWLSPSKVEAKHSRSPSWQKLMWWASLVAQRASPGAKMVKNLPAMREIWIWSLCWEDPLEESTATHSSILAWRIPMDGRAWWATVHGVTIGLDWATKHSTRLGNDDRHKGKGRVDIDTFKAH